VPPIAAIQGPPSGYVGEPVSFSASGSTPGSSPIQSYTWDFGDGVTAAASSGSEATHLYNSGGTYQATVIVADANGLTSSATTQITINARLDTTVWSIPRGSQNSSVVPAPGSAITLQFLNGQLTGFAGCNSYTGSYTAVDNGDGTYAVSGSNISTSRLTCPPEVMAAENAYLQALAQVVTAQVQGNLLVLTYPGGQLAFNELYTPR
jgi:heat shock protein HslJ